MDKEPGRFDQASVYSELSRTVQQKHASKLLSYVTVKEGDRILDVGCGAGSLVKVMVELVGPTGHIVGVDPDEDRLGAARNLLRGYSNVEFHRSRSNDFPAHEDKPFDVVVSNMVYHWTQDHEKVESFARVYKSLKPGGLFAASMALGSFKNFELLFGAYFRKHPEALPAFQNTVASCIWRVSGEWLQKQLSDIGFTRIVVEEASVTVSVPTVSDFIEWCQATATNTHFAQFNYRAIYEEVSKDLELERLPNGEVDLTFPTVYFCAQAPSDS